MSWLQVKKKHKHALINFILKDEWAHVSFSEKIKTWQRGYTIIADYNDVSGRVPFFGFRKNKPAVSRASRCSDHGPGLGYSPGHSAGYSQGHNSNHGPGLGYNHGNSSAYISGRSTVRNPPASVGSAILFSQYGIMFPIFSQGSLINTEKLEPYMKGFRRNIYSIMGIKNDVVAAEKLLKLNPNTQINYYLMLLTAEEFFKNYDFHGAKDRPQESYITERISIKRATVRDAKRLFPLERDYQLEEVILNPRNYNPKFILEMFKKTLAKNIVLFAEKDGLPVAKAGTNAQGFYTDQIGGVYTVRQERGSGFAREVMIRLLGCIFKDKKTASLFVKKGNVPAVKLYEHLGFTIVNDFKISYF